MAGDNVWNECYVYRITVSCGHHESEAICICEYIQTPTSCLQYTVIMYKDQVDESET